ncbi:MAG: hypothetical protein WDO70_00825 [Alphaproteobacteria bacterium]
MNEFIPSGEKEPGVVYHCIPTAATGDCIRPSNNYGTEIPPEIRRKLGLPMEGNPPLVFASPYITKAMAFGLQGSLGETICNGSIEDSDNELVLACERGKLMARQRDITIYAMADRDFVTLERADRQAVAARPIPFSEARVAFKASSAEDLMRGGLQILAFDESFKELGGYGFVKKTMETRGHKDFYHFLADMVREGKVKWENAERGLNPDPVLARKIGVPLAPAPGASRANGPSWAVSPKI